MKHKPVSSHSGGMKCMPTNSIMKKGMKKMGTGNTVNIKTKK